MTHPFLHDARLIAVEVGAQPVDDLLDAADLLPAFLRTQRRVGGERHALIERDRRALAEPGERCDQQPFLAERLPVAHRVVMEGVRTAHPDRAAATFQPVVEDDARALTALAGARAIAEEPAAPEPTRKSVGVGQAVACRYDTGCARTT